MQEMTEDACYKDTLNQGGKGGRKQLQCKFARLDESNLSSPTIIYAQ